MRSSDKNRSKIGLVTRLKLAWFAFWLKDFYQEAYSPYQVIAELQNRRHYDCDIEGCDSRHKYCMSRGNLSLTIDLEQIEHKHVCEDHSKCLEGHYEDHDELIYKRTNYA